MAESKSSLIRDTIAHEGALPLSRLMERIGLQNRKKTLDLCVFMRGKGQLTIDRSGDEPLIGPGSGKPRKASKASKRAAKPARHKKARKARQVRPFKALVEKHTAAVPVLRDLLLDNLIASAENLAATLRREVEGIETNPTLIAAIEQQERAAQIARAA